MSGVDAGSSATVTQLSEAWVRRAERLLHDQCWCWGRDVERPEGNLLLEFGFERIRNAEGRTFAYDLQRPEASATGERVVLAGSGLCYVPATSTVAAVLGRYDIRPRMIGRGEVDLPRWAAIGAGVFRSIGTPDAGSPLARLVLACTVRWIASYEAWVRSVAGTEYRARCLASWPRASVAADHIVEHWEALLRDLDVRPGDGLGGQLHDVGSPALDHEACLFRDAG